MNFLLTASNYLPILGILFETLDRAKRDILTFTLLAVLIFLISSVSCYLMFGSSMSQFKTLGDSITSNFLMFFGEIPYDEMYAANKLAAAVFPVVFVFIFSFFLMNVYTAIISENYQRLRVQKHLLSAAMMRILIREAKKDFNNWTRLLFVTGSDRNEKKDGEEEKESTNPRQFRMQICRNNWARVRAKRITTKAEFIEDLRQTAEEIKKEQERKREDWAKRLAGEKKDAIDAESSYSIVRRSVVFVVYLIITWLFFDAVSC